MTLIERLRKRFWWCDCEANKALCVLDILNHDLLRRWYIRRICDAHDYSITREYPPEDDA